MRIVLAALGLLALSLFNGFLGGLAEGTPYSPLTLLWSLLSGGVYGCAAFFWVVR